MISTAISPAIARGMVKQIERKAQRDEKALNLYKKIEAVLQDRYCSGFSKMILEFQSRGERGPIWNFYLYISNSGGFLKVCAHASAKGGRRVDFPSLNVALLIPGAGWKHILNFDDFKKWHKVVSKELYEKGVRS